MADSSATPKQMQVRVTFFTSHNPQSVLMILKNDCALEQIAEKASQLFPSANYRLFYGDVNGPIYEFTDSEQVMAKIRITSFSRTPQLFVRLEPLSVLFTAPKKSKDRESKSSSSLKRIEQNQEETMKSLNKMQKQFERVTHLEEAVVELQKKVDGAKAEPKKRNIKLSKHSATCDACLGDILGHRYKCLECPDFDLCESCEKNSVHYEHAMVRLVCPRKTSIPSYVTLNAPNNVFPSYMRTHVIHLDVPLPTAAAPKQQTASEPVKVNTEVPSEARAAVMQSIGMLKDTFHVLSKSFLDLADGAQAGMDKKFFERSKLEAGMAMVEDKIDLITRQCDEKYFGAAGEKVEAKKEEPKLRTYESLDNSDSSYFGPYEPKAKKTNKKKVYKQAGSKLSSNSNNMFSAFDTEEAKRRADASTAELQRKLSELNNPKSEEARPAPAMHGPGFPGYEHFGDYLHIGSGGGRGISFADWYQEDTLKELLRSCGHSTLEYTPAFPETPLNTSQKATEAVDDVRKIIAESNVQGQVAQSVAAEIQARALAEAQETQAMVKAMTEALVEVQAKARLDRASVGQTVLPHTEAVPVQQEDKEEESLKSVHSSFENISSDFENVSPTWGVSPTELAAASIAPEAVDTTIASAPPATELAIQPVVLAENSEDDDDMEFYDGEETVQQRPPAVVEPALTVTDEQTERTFDRLLEMGFDYNVVVDAIKNNGSDLQKCLQALIQ